MVHNIRWEQVCVGVYVGRLEARSVGHGTDDCCAADLNRTGVDLPPVLGGSSTIYGIANFGIHSFGGNFDIER